MDKRDIGKNVSRRDVLKLAGTAAAFCTSFGFALAGQLPSAVQDKHLQAKWTQTQIKWYAGRELLHSSAIPAKVAKHLSADLSATVEVKLFQAGRILKNLGTIQAKG